MPVAMEGSPCPWCEGKGLRPYHRVAVLGTYHDPLKEIIHRIKYHRRWAVAEKLADRLLHCPRALAILQETDVLVPVPLHALRQMRRGFNQADVIAQRLARRMKLLRVVRPVVRLRATETQTVLHGRSQRVKNLKHAFGLLDPSALAGKRVTVVDDVLTTGATLQSLARTLKPARPARLCALALAIADPEGRNFEMV
jgi:ComF family protein